MKGVVIEMDDGEKEIFENNSGFEYNYKIEGGCAIVTRTALKDGDDCPEQWALFAADAWASARYID